MIAFVLLRVLLILLLVAANAFFAAAEFALVSVRDTRIQQLIESGRTGARIVQRLHQHLDEVVNGVQLGIMCIAAFDILENEPERIERLWANTRYFQGELRRAGFNIGGITTPATETPITPIIIGEGRAAMDFSRALFDEGVMGTGIAFPTVPEGRARIRLILTSEHTRAQLDRAIETLEHVAKKMGILQ